jgi:hypothetical protein
MGPLSELYTESKKAESEKKKQRPSEDGPTRTSEPTCNLLMDGIS